MHVGVFQRSHLALSLRLVYLLDGFLYFPHGTQILGKSLFVSLQDLYLVLSLHLELLDLERTQQLTGLVGMVVLLNVRID